MEQPEQLDSTVLATALPAMAGTFGTSAPAMSIALTSYILSLAVFIPIPIRYCRITVRKTSGEPLVTEGDDFKFEPLPIPEIFERDGSGVLPPEKIARASELVGHLEDVSDMALVSETLRPGGLKSDAPIDVDALPGDVTRLG
jgi:hypothetical protein